MSSAMNSFSQCSYYELLTRFGYASLFPTSDPTCNYVGELPQNGSKLFDFENKSRDVLENELFLFLSALASRNFGIKDNMFFLNKFQKDMNSSSILDFVESLYFKSSSLENSQCVSMIGSTLDETFNLKLYVKGGSLPQEALDTFVFFQDESDCDTIYTILGTKRKSPTVTVHFTDGRTVDVLEIGLFGSVIVGEHLEPNEKKELNSTYFRYLKNRDETDRQVMKLDPKNVSAPMRGLLEELGFEPSAEFKPFMIGKDQVKGRDLRYWDFTYEGVQFGYQRRSASLMVAFVGKCKPPELSEPLDQYECSKGKIVDVDYALHEFCVGGKLDCAFPSHSRMLCDAVKLLPEMFAEC
jgi:hypothetical protein